MGDDLARAQYWVAPATRQELEVVIAALNDTMCHLIDMRLAGAGQHPDAETQEGFATTAKHLSALSTLLREIHNAGVDPEWDHRA